jgi:outer membrane receptor protein involved in Fe transport
LGDKLGRFIWHLDASTKSEVYNDAENTPLLRQPGLTLLNSSLAFQSYDYNWKITVGGTNLTNETYLVSGFSIPAVGIAYGIHARPAEFNLGVSYKF